MPHYFLRLSWKLSILNSNRISVAVKALKIGVISMWPVAKRLRKNVILFFLRRRFTVLLCHLLFPLGQENVPTLCLLEKLIHYIVLNLCPKGFRYCVWYNFDILSYRFNKNCLIINNKFLLRMF